MYCIKTIFQNLQNRFEYIGKPTEPIAARFLNGVSHSGIGGNGSIGKSIQDTLGSGNKFRDDARQEFGSVSERLELLEAGANNEGRMSAGGRSSRAQRIEMEATRRQQEGGRGQARSTAAAIGS